MFATCGVGAKRGPPTTHTLAKGQRISDPPLRTYVNNDRQSAQPGTYLRALQTRLFSIISIYKYTRGCRPPESPLMKASHIHAWVAISTSHSSRQ